MCTKFADFFSSHIVQFPSAFIYLLLFDWNEFHRLFFLSILNCHGSFALHITRLISQILAWIFLHIANEVEAHGQIQQQQIESNWNEQTYTKWTSYPIYSRSVHIVLKWYDSQCSRNITIENKTVTVFEWMRLYELALNGEKPLTISSNIWRGFFFSLFWRV